MTSVTIVTYNRGGGVPKINEKAITCFVNGPKGFVIVLLIHFFFDIPMFLKKNLISIVL